AVKVASPKPQPLHWTIEQPATVQPFEVTPVVAKLPGYVREIAPDAAAIARGAKPDAVIDIGSAVRKDQPLAFVDIPELAAEAEADARATTAAAQLLERQARKGRVEADVVAAQKRVAVAEAAVKRLEALLTYTVVRAPFAGVVTARNVHPGHFLQPGPGSPG